MGFALHYLHQTVPVLHSFQFSDFPWFVFNLFCFLACVGIRVSTSNAETEESVTADSLRSTDTDKETQSCERRILPYLPARGLGLVSL